MRTVREMSRLTGVSVRTLHHYDAIGLLKPSQTTQAGYRLYDDAALTRLQNILMFRELRFPLKEIKAILDSPDFDPQEALAQQIKLLELQAAHLQLLIRFAREVQRKGVEQMDFHAFNREELDRYAEEVGGHPGLCRIRRKQQRSLSRPARGGGCPAIVPLCTVGCSAAAVFPRRPHRAGAAFRFAGLHHQPLLPLYQ